MAPFLVCDPQAGVTQYRIDITDPTGAKTQQQFASQADGSAKFDLAPELAVGKYTFDLLAADAGGFWTAASIPLVATRFNPPGNLRIS
jgi:hypothetical protein